MAVLGTVISINGKTDAVNHVMVVTEGGVKRPLNLNDSIQTGDTIITPKGVIVELQLDNGKVLQVFAEQTVKFSPEFIDAIPPSSGDSAVDQATIKAIITAIEEGHDIGEVLDGIKIDDESTVSYGFDFVNLLRIVQNLTPLAFNNEFERNETLTINPIFDEPDRNFLSGQPGAGSGPGAPPSAPAAADMTAATDTGVSSTDNNTGNNTPDFTVVVPAGFTATLYIDGVATPANLVGGVLTPTVPIADGPHIVTYTVTNLAAVESAQSAGLPVVIDTVDPAAPAAPDMTAATDTGVSNSDDETSDTTPDFTVVVPAGHTA
ncbi:MAG: retention module-containing protein, partial [Methylophilaceae bacterium]